MRCNPQKNNIIAQIATLHSHNITLRNNKKSYNQTTTKNMQTQHHTIINLTQLRTTKWLTISTH
ncbi:hypothetical protein EWA93_07955 [Haemophilus influenzae]|nr:hypothetical protein EWA93_07955 [Haemophilus influenzae]